MMALADRAVALNPNSARSWALSAYLRIWAGQLDIALEHHEASDRLSPRARVGTSPLAIGGVHFLARRFDEAVPKLLIAIQEDPSGPQGYRYLAACYAHMGQLDEAQQIIERLRTIAPVMISDASYMRNAKHRELLLSGLRLATGEATLSAIAASPLFSPTPMCIAPLRRGASTGMAAHHPCRRLWRAGSAANACGHRASSRSFQRPIRPKGGQHGTFGIPPGSPRAASVECWAHGGSEARAEVLA